MRKTTLKTRLWTSMGLMIALVVVIGSLNMFSTYEISQQTKSIEQNAYPIALNAQSLQLWIERALATISAAAFAARADLLEGLDAIEGPLKRDLAILKQLVRHSPHLLEKTNHIEQHYASTHAVGIQWVQATLAEDWNREPELGREFINLADHLKQDIAMLKGDGLKGFEHSINRITKQTEIVWASTSAVFLVGFGCFVFLTFRLYRAITDPIRSLLTVVHKISQVENDFSQRVVLGANDEIGQLGSAFNRMLECLERSQRQIRGYTIGLEEKVQERTAQLQQEKEALRESEQHLQAIWDSTPSGIVVIDRESHQIIDANPYARKLLDRTPEELIGHECHSFICPAEKGKCPITDLGQKVDGSERKLVKASGETIPILKTVIPFTKQGRKLLVESFIDIAELKKTQERLRASIDAAKAANQAKSDFLANMSHELRTPLNHIIGFTELALDPAFGNLSDTHGEFLNDVLASSKHLLSLINDILDLSKVESGKMDLQLSEVNLKLMLENSMKMVKEKSLKHSIQLSIKTQDAPEVIQADERKLKQIVYNLLSNAVKFTHPGGKVEVSAKPCDRPGTQILGTHPALADYVEIAVSDTGVGLASKDLERIFDPFEQADNSNGRQGTGLGLALTRRFVELHNGIIWAESEGLKKGSMFRIVIPVSQKQTTCPLKPAGRLFLNG